MIEKAIPEEGSPTAVSCSPHHDLPLNDLGFTTSWTYLKTHNKNHTDTMCINKSTASGLQVQETPLHSKHSEIPGPEPITTAIGFASLKSVTVSTVKKTKTSCRVKGNERGTVLPSKPHSTFLDAAIV